MDISRKLWRHFGMFGWSCLLIRLGTHHKSKKREWWSSDKLTKRPRPTWWELKLPRNVWPQKTTTNGLQIDIHYHVFLRDLTPGLKNNPQWPPDRQIQCHAFLSDLTPVQATFKQTISDAQESLTQALIDIVWKMNFFYWFTNRYYLTIFPHKYCHVN